MEQKAKKWRSRLNRGLIALLAFVLLCAAFVVAAGIYVKSLPDKTIKLADEYYKTLGRRHIVKDASFNVYEGEIFGFLGPNGAGKTTTIKMILGFLFPDSGEIRICGRDLRTEYEAAMACVGGIVENPDMFRDFSGLDNHKMYAAVHGGVRIQPPVVRNGTDLRPRVHHRQRRDQGRIDRGSITVSGTYAVESAGENCTVSVAWVLNKNGSGFRGFRFNF